MKNRWVINASPLILLAKIGRLELLSKLADELIIPESVVKEIMDGPGEDTARNWIAAKGKSVVMPDVAVPALLAAWDLGAGETAVLAYAMANGGYESILDDRAARNFARVHRMRYRGTFGVILAARKRHLIPKARAVCEEIISAGLYLDSATLEAGLQLVGE